MARNKTFLFWQLLLPSSMHTKIGIHLQSKNKKIICIKHIHHKLINAYKYLPNKSKKDWWFNMIIAPLFSDIISGFLKFHVTPMSFVTFLDVSAISLKRKKLIK